MAAREPVGAGRGDVRLWNGEGSSEQLQGEQKHPVLVRLMTDIVCPALRICKMATSTQRVSEFNLEEMEASPWSVGDGDVRPILS